MWHVELNDGNVALFWTMGRGAGVVDPHGNKMKNWRFRSDENSGKIVVCTCLLSSEGCDSSFPKKLDLTLAPNKTNEVIM